MTRGISALLVTLALAGCAKPPPPQPPPKPAAPVLPAAPIPKDQYIRSWVDFTIDEIFVGAPMYRSILQWMAAGKIHNRGNRTITHMEVRFEIQETGHRSDVVVLDPMNDQSPIPPGKVQPVNVPVCSLNDGVAGDEDIDAEKASSLPPPHVKVTIIDLGFSD